jgi:outer membrane immunogenic protein
MWRRVVIASTSFLACLSIAHGQEAIPEVSDSPPTFASWAGYYIGVNGGYGWSAASRAVQISNQVDEASEKLAGPSASGGFGGVQFGYNWQGLLEPHLVLGFEGDLDYPQITGSSSASTTGPLPGSTVQSSLNAFGTLRGRAGFSWDHALIYAMAGVAFGDVKDTVVGRYSLSHDFSSNTTVTKSGYVAGGGIEWTLTPNWSLKGEYEFLNLGGSGISGCSSAPSPGDTLRTSGIDHEYHTVRIGLNYHTTAAYQAMK